MESTCKYIEIKYFFILVGLLLSSCNQQLNEKSNYPQDSTFSDIHGKPHDSITYYFPTSIKKDSLIVKVEMEDYFQNYLSSSLYCMKEPILFNYYLEHEIYRFLWKRSFNKPVLLILSKDINKVNLTQKVLDRQPQFMDIVHLIPTKKCGKKNKNFVSSESQFEDSLVKANRQATLIVNTTKQLSLKEWEKFEILLKKCSFWETKPFVIEFGIDGSQWTIEAHLKDKYWFVTRHSPTDNFYTAGKYLIDLAGLTEQSYEY